MPEVAFRAEKLGQRCSGIKEPYTLDAAYQGNNL